MKRWLVSALIVSSAVAAGVGFANHCPGCIDRSRVNKTCAWTGDSSFRVDSRDSAHQWHLVADAQLAEELAIRYADAEFGRLHGYEAHGGLEGSVRQTCMAQLVATIERSHGVSADQIEAARGRRDWRFDAAVALLFVPLYAAGALLACRHLTRRFSSDEPAVRRTAVGLAAVGVSALGLQLGQLWLGAWETLRVGNGHISVFRAATYTRWPHQHGGAAFVAAIAMFLPIEAGVRRAALRTLTRHAALFASTMLGATFAAVFPGNAAGYLLIAVATVVFLTTFARKESAGGGGNVGTWLSIRSSRPRSSPST